jgi:hypothetical protein
MLSMTDKVQHFYPRIHLVFTPGRKGAFLSENFRYTDKRGHVHTCYKGMLTDGLSIPRFFYRFIDPPFDSFYLGAALIHDKYCDCARDVWNAGNHTEARVLRKSADKLFHEMLLFLDCPKWKAGAMYSAVRLGAIKISNNKRAK